MSPLPPTQASWTRPAPSHESNTLISESNVADPPEFRLHVDALISPPVPNTWYQATGLPGSMLTIAPVWSSKPHAGISPEPGRASGKIGLSSLREPCVTVPNSIVSAATQSQSCGS